MQIISNQVPDWASKGHRKNKFSDIHAALDTVAKSKQPALVFSVEKASAAGAKQSVLTWKRTALKHKVISSADAIRMASRVVGEEVQVCVIFTWRE